jgi:hypothetical protein
MIARTSAAAASSKRPASRINTRALAIAQTRAAFKNGKADRLTHAQAKAVARKIEDGKLKPAVVDRSTVAYIVDNQVYALRTTPSPDDRGGTSTFYKIGRLRTPQLPQARRTGFHNFKPTNLNSYRTQDGGGVILTGKNTSGNTTHVRFHRGSAGNTITVGDMGNDRAIHPAEKKALAASLKAYLSSHPNAPAADQYRDLIRALD